MTALFTLPRANLFSNTETGSKKQLNENLKKKKKKKKSKGRTAGSFGHVANAKSQDKLAYQTQAICQVLNN